MFLCLFNGLALTAFLILSSSTWVYIVVVDIFLCPSIFCKVLISTSPYLWRSVAAVCLNLCTVYFLLSSPAFSMLFLIIFSTSPLLICLFLSDKKRYVHSDSFLTSLYAFFTFPKKESFVFCVFLLLVVVLVLLCCRV